MAAAATSYSWSKGTSGNDDYPPIVRQVDTLQRIAQDAKKELLGADWFRNVKDFYSLNSSQGQGPLVWRPRVDVPQLQMFMLAETAELTENTPTIVITQADRRDEPKERILKGLWRTEFYNLKIMLAGLWANFGGTGILAYGIDPWALNGRGTIWAEPVDPEFFDPDPIACDDTTWQYVVYSKPMYWDEIVARWPERGYQVPRGAVARTPAGDTVAGMALPFGPMQGFSPAYGAKPQRQTNLINVRFCYTLDPTPEKMTAAEGSKAADGFLTATKFKLMFPNGRLTILADNVVLYDGNNPTPRRKFPFIPFYGMPKLEGFWAPPPIRYTRTLQEYAERSLTQAYENAYRTNNSIWILPDGSGVSADKFGGLPGEIQVMSMLHGEPKCITPNAFPSGYIEYIKFALQLQAELQGYSGPRGGQPGAGNLSVELYEAAIEESSKLTKLRSRLGAVSVQKFAEAIFAMSTQLYRDGQMLPVFNPEFGMEQWRAVSSDALDEYGVWVDPGSVEVMSAKNWRKTALMLNQAGKLPDEKLLEALGVPGAKELSEEAQQEMALKALAGILKGSGAKKR